MRTERYRLLSRQDQEKSENSKVINVRVSLLAAQMSSETDFSTEENLIDISLSCPESMC